MAIIAVCDIVDNVMYSSTYEWKLIRIWYDCVLFGVIRLEDVNKDNIVNYHDHIHEYQIIYRLLTTFFGSLSVFVLEYVGIIRDDEVYIPSLDNSKNNNDNIKHKDTVVIQNYIFEMEKDDFSSIDEPRRSAL